MSGTFLLSLITLALLALLIALPLLFIVLQAIFPQLGAGDFSHAFSAFTLFTGENELGSLLLHTVQLGLGVMTGSLLIGAPLGALRGLFRIPGAGLWDLLFLLPFLLPPYIAALAWMMALQPGGYLMQASGIHLGEWLYSYQGMVLVMTLGTFPVIYFAVSRSLAAAGQQLANAARVHGASAWRAFFHISTPLCLPALAASMLLSFILAIEEYGVPAALGRQANFYVLTTAIERRLSDWPIDLASAALLSLLLVSLALCAYTLQRAILRGKNFETTSGKPVPFQHRELGVYTLPVTALFALVALLAVAAPIASMLASALQETVSGGLHWHNLGLRHFQALFQTHGSAAQALGNSVALALGTACVTGLLGFLAAWLIQHQGGKLAICVDSLALLPASLPSIVVGVGLILAWNQGFWPASPYGHWTILLLSYSCLLLPYPVRYVSAALRQISTNLEAAARVHGATASVSLRLIVFPLISPSLIAAMLIVFAIASRELVTSLLLAPPGIQTVSIYIWGQFEQGAIGQGMAMACVAATISLLLLTLGLKIQARYSAP